MRPLGAPLPGPEGGLPAAPALVHTKGAGPARAAARVRGLRDCRVRARVGSGPPRAACVHELLLLLRGLQDLRARAALSPPGATRPQARATPGTPPYAPGGRGLLCKCAHVEKRVADAGEWLGAAGGRRPPTWKEHMSVSSTLIMAPALSNSPQ